MVQYIRIAGCFEAFEDLVEVITPAALSVIVIYALLSMASIQHLSHIEWVASTF
jgi:hypothetical protein